MGNCDIGNSIDSRLSAKRSEYISRIETGKATMNRPLMPKMVRKPTEKVVIAIWGGGRPRAWKASLTAFPPGAPYAGAIQGSLTNSARSILRRRTQGLAGPAARQI